MTPLLAQVRRGDRAFERLYRRQVAGVYRYALALLRDPDDAEDVTQTTFINAYREFARGERPRNANAWLLTLAHGVCRQRVRAATGRGLDIDDDFAARAVPDEAPPTASEICRGLARLTFNQRAALVMRELEGRSYAEIAQVLELPPAAVETLVFEGRRAMREHLEGTLSCREAKRAISRQIDGRLARPERKPLRRHLRECDECTGFARSQRAQRPAWKTLASVPLPASLQSFFGPGGVMDNPRVRRAGVVAVGRSQAFQTRQRPDEARWPHAPRRDRSEPDASARSRDRERPQRRADSATAARSAAAPAGAAAVPCRSPNRRSSLSES